MITLSLSLIIDAADGYAYDVFRQITLYMPLPCLFTLLMTATPFRLRHFRYFMFQ